MKGLFTVLGLCSLALLLSAKQGQDDPEQDASELIKDIMALRNAVRQTNTFVEEQTTALKMREGQQEESEAPEKLLAVTSEQEVTLKRHNDVIQHLLDTLRVQPASAELHDQRQLRSDDFGYRLNAVVSQLTQRLTEVEAELASMKTAYSTLQQQQGAQAQSRSSGAIYTRWGHDSCPDSAELVYSGSMGGSYYTSAGAAANSLCLPPNPVFDNRTAPLYHAQLAGAEYQTHGEPTMYLEPACAVCRIPRATQLTLPATNACLSGWTLEYSGYLMAGLTSHPAASEYVCVDSSLGYLPGTQANNNGKFLFYTVTSCGSLACPPYVNNKVVLCAVCSK